VSSLAGDESAVMRIAVDAVRDACAVCRRLQGVVSALSKADLSPVTVADFAAQAVVARRLSRELGSVRIVGEESGDLLRDPGRERAVLAALDAVRASLPHDPDWKNAGPADLISAVERGASRQAGGEFWALDPIDGTKGFLRGQQYCTALALIRDGVPTIGVLGCPNLRGVGAWGFEETGGGAIVWARRGAGATVSDLEGRGAVVPRVRECAGAIVLASSVVSSEPVDRATERVLARLPAGSSQERLDSQAKYALVALGLADAFLRLPVARRSAEWIWDHAAGVVVCREAGARVTDAGGRELDFGAGLTLSKNRGVVAASPAVHGKLLSILAELGLDAG
jgi:3'(2'), 5'-bisphosphate nucleotidase